MRASIEIISLRCEYFIHTGCVSKYIPARTHAHTNMDLSVDKHIYGAFKQTHTVKSVSIFTSHLLPYGKNDYITYLGRSASSQFLFVLASRFIHHQIKQMTCVCVTMGNSITLHLNILNFACPPAATSN